MSRINDKLGLRPQTTVRQATHGSGIVSHAKCPRCPCRHVVEHRVRGIPTRLCGACGYVWTPPFDDPAP